MPLPQLLDADADATRVCDVAERWGIHPTLAWRLHYLARALPFEILIISGARTVERQRELQEEPDTTAAPAHLSTHTSCPATGADLRPSATVTDQLKLELGRAAEALGLRWGGGAPRENGIPVGNEWRHVDLGRRQ